MSSTEENPDSGSHQPEADQQPAGDQGTQPPVLPPIPPEGTAAPPQPDRSYGSAPEGEGRGSTATKAPDQGRRPDSSNQDSHGGAHRLGSQRPGDRPGDRGAPTHGRQPLGEEDRRRVLIRGKLALVLGVGALVFSVPLFPLGLALGVGAIVLGVTAGRAGRGGGFAVPGSQPGLVLGVIATCVAGLVTAGAMVFYAELTDWQDCLSGANTRSGEEICQEEFSDRMTERLNGLGIDVDERLF